MIARLRSAGLVPLSIATLIALAILLGLGTWQLSRRTWKEQILATMAAREKLAPVTNASWQSLKCPGPEAVPVDQDPCDFRPVRLTVTPASPDERHIFIAVPRQPNGIGGPGYWVFQRHRLAPPAAGEVYVNRGFVPEAQKALAAATAIRGDRRDRNIRRAAPRRTTRRLFECERCRQEHLLGPRTARNGRLRTGAIAARAIAALLLRR